MAEDRDQLLQHYRAMRAELLGALDGLDDALLSEPTLDGWSIKDHLLHLTAWDDLRAAEVVRISAGQETAWRMTDEQGDVYNAMAHELRKGLSPGQARWELASSHDRLLEAIAGATAQGLDSGRYGDPGLLSTHEDEHTSWIRRWRGGKGL